MEVWLCTRRLRGIVWDGGFSSKRTSVDYDINREIICKKIMSECGLESSSEKH